MGASDWAGKMAKEMEREFGVEQDRSLRITDLVRLIISNPHFEYLREHDDFDEKKFPGTFTQNLIGSLKAQRDAETLERRWNKLAREEGLHEVAGVDVYLGPWLGNLDRHRRFENYGAFSVFKNASGHRFTKEEISEIAWETDKEVNHVGGGFLIDGGVYVLVEEKEREKQGSSVGQLALGDMTDDKEVQQFLLDEVDVEWEPEGKREASEEGASIKNEDVDNDVHRARNLFKKAVDSPEEVDEDAIYSLMSVPPVSGPVYANAVRALTRVAVERDDVGGRFVEPLERFLKRPPLKDTIALAALRHVASNDPGAVAEIHEEIISKVDVEATLESEDHGATRAATGCCVEIACDDAEALVGYVPLFGSLLASRDETTRRNCMYVLTQVADDYPEEVLPAVDDVADSLRRDGEDPDGTKSSLIGRVARHYPDAVSGAAPELRGLLSGSDVEPHAKANAAGALACIAKEHPDVVLECVRSSSLLLEHDDETVRYNVCGLLEELSKSEPEEVKKVSQEIIERLEDTHPGVRLKTVFILGEIREQDAIGRLKNKSKKDSSRRVRELASRAVDRIEEGAYD